MFYNGIFLEVSYDFDTRNSSMTFERLAATALTKLEPEIERFKVSIYNNIDGTFGYSLKGYISGIAMPATYEVKSTKNRFEESIMDTEGNILFFRCGKKPWNRKFFDIENWTSEPLQELSNYKWNEKD